MNTAIRARRVSIRAAVGTLTLTLALAGCSPTGSGGDTPSTPAAKPSFEFAGPNGEKPGALSELSLTNDELAKVKEGKYTAAFVWHTSSDFVSAVEKGAREEFKKLGIDVVASTQANFNAATQANNVQTVLALHPNIIVTIAVDPTSAAKAFKPAVDAGTKLAIMTTPPPPYHPPEHHRNDRCRSPLRCEGIQPCRRRGDQTRHHDDSSRRIPGRQGVRLHSDGESDRSRAIQRRDSRRCTRQEGRSGLHLVQRQLLVHQPTRQGVQRLARLRVPRHEDRRLRRLRR